jgi:hypothetical protein
VKRLFGFVAAILTSIVLTFGAGATVSAATCSTASNPLTCACGSGANTSDACKATTTNPLTGPNGVFKKVSLVIAFIAGVSAVIVILVAGVMFVTAGGDAQKVAGARKTIIGAVIGLVVIAMSEALVIFVVSKV